MLSLLTVKDIAMVLRVSDTHVRNLIHRGEIRAFLCGRKGGYRTNESELKKYLNKRMGEEGGDETYM